MLQSEFSSALNQLAAERGVSPEAVLETIRAAMISAYRKEYSEDDVEAEGIEVIIDPDTGETKLMNEGKDITPSGFGRIAAQTAKQVILQKINEAEKQAIIEEYRKKLGSIVSGNIFRVEKGVVIVELGKTQGIMPPQEQITSEHYQVGTRIRFLLKEIKEGERGAEVVISRASPDFVRVLFALEVPEISAGTVTIESLAREAGLRSKVAVLAHEERVDPVGSCVGQKGVRVQAIMDELGDERIDIIPYSEDMQVFIANALSPAKVKLVELNEAHQRALVEVDEDQLSLAIGKGGQNVRLAAKLTGWKIDVKGAEGVSTTTGDLSSLNLSSRTQKVLLTAGIHNLNDLRAMNESDLKSLPGIGPKALAEIREALQVKSENNESSDNDS